MRACLALCVVSALVGAALADCAACIDGLCYRQHPLPATSGTPMGIDRNTNVLYYMYDKRLYGCNLNITTCNAHNALHLLLLQSFTIDQETGDVYVIHPLSYGIYKLNVSNRTLSLLLKMGLYHIVYKDRLYYSRGIPDGIFTFENGESRIVRGTEGYNVRRFIVDKHNDIYFEDYTNNKNVRLRRWRSGVVQDGSWENSYSMTVDEDGSAVFFRPESRSVYRVTRGQLIEIGAINGSVYSPLLFDIENNLVYRSSAKEFTFLKKLRDVHCSVSMLENERVITEIVLEGSR